MGAGAEQGFVAVGVTSRAAAFGEPLVFAHLVLDLPDQGGVVWAGGAAERVAFDFREPEVIFGEIENLLKFHLTEVRIIVQAVHDLGGEDGAGEFRAGMQLDGFGA